MPETSIEPHHEVEKQTMQRIHVIATSKARINRDADDLSVYTRVVIKNANDVEFSSPGLVVFPGAAMQAHGTDADRMEFAMKASPDRIGFTVDATWDGRDARWTVDTIVEILRDGTIPSQDPDKRLIAELKAEMEREGRVKIFPDEFARLMALVEKAA